MEKQLQMTNEEKNTIIGFQKKYQVIIKNTKISNQEEQLDIEEKSWRDWYRKTYGYDHISGNNNGLCACGKHITASYSEAMSVSLF
jgi:hypothetical protein